MKPKRAKNMGKAPQAAPRPNLNPMLLPALILIAALALRTVSLTTFDTLFDEQITKDVVTGIWHGDWSNNWKHTVTVRGYGIDLYNFSSYLYADALVAGTASELSGGLEGGKPDLLFWSRLFSALAGAFAVFLFYLVARRWFGPRTALIAMLLIAAMPLLVQDAHYARPEAFVVALTVAAYWFVLRFDSSPGRLRYLAYSAFCFGLLIACKISLLPMALVPILFLLRFEDRRFLIRAIGICAGGALLGAFLGVPHAFFHPSDYWRGVQFLQHQYATANPPHALIDGANSVSLTALYFKDTMGYLFCLLVFAGAFVLARTRRFLLLAAIVGPVAFYAIYFSLQRTFFERNLSHVAPLMALLAAVALTALGETIPAKARTAGLAALVALTAGPALWVSGKLVFVAMRGTTEQRARSYEDALMKTQQTPVGLVLSLLTEFQVDYVSQSTAAASGDLLMRLIDFHDSFTRKHLAEVRQREVVREVGYFPSVFEGFHESTLIAYHAPSIRYLLIRPPSPAPGTEFVSWVRADRPLAPASIRLSTWWEIGGHPPALADIHTRFFGSFTDAKDANTGALELGPLDVRGVPEIGIPLSTGSNSGGLSLVVRDHRTGDPIARLAPPPVLTGWHLLRIDLAGRHPDEVDVIADDEGSGTGQWLAIGSPVTLKPM